MNNFGNRRKVSAFISYVASDNQASNYHQLLRDHLRKNGIENVWIATDMSAGEQWEDVIDERLDDSTHLILIWTPGASESRYVTYEWSVAFVLGLQIILVFAPQYGSVRPDEIPDILRKFHLIQDPIAGQQDQGQLNKSFIEAERTDHCQMRFGLPSASLLKFRSADPDDWAHGEAELQQWIKSSKPDVQKVDQVRWLLDHLVPLNASRDQTRHARSVRRELEALVDYPEKLRELYADAAQNDEENELEFRQRLQRMAKRLRERGLDGVAIREEVKEAVAMWSRERYGTERPPCQPLSRSKQFARGKRTCGLCRLKDAEANEHGCCTDCGIFFTFWDPSAPEEEAKS